MHGNIFASFSFVSYPNNNKTMN